MSEKKVSTIQIKKRRSGNKGHARRHRLEGFIPGILYGSDRKEEAISINSKAFEQQWRVGTHRVFPCAWVAEGEEGNAVAGEMDVLIKDLQIDPISRKVIHVDLWALAADKEVKVKIPLVIEGRSKGEGMGGVLTQTRRDILVRCLPSNIPESITMDVRELNIEDILRVEDLTLPEGVTSQVPDRVALVLVAASRQSKSAGAEEGAASTEAAAA